MQGLLAGDGGAGGLWEAAAGTDGQTQEVEMTFFAAEPAFLSLRAAASSNYPNNYK